MAKLTAWLVTILGLVILLQASAIMPALDSYYLWIDGILVLVIGIGKLMRNYSKKRK